MVLSIDGTEILNRKKILSPNALLQNVLSQEYLKDSAKNYRSKSIKKFTSDEDALYVHQGHCAPCEITPNAPSWIGTDDATSCHSIVFYCHNRCFFCHIDFISRVDELLVRAVSYLEENGSSIDVFIVGGFKNQCEVGQDILYKMCLNEDVIFNLKLCCIGILNNVIIDEVNHPFCTGSAFNTAELCLEPAKFSLKARGPVSTLRCALSYSSPYLQCIFDPDEYCIRIDPFNVNFQVYPDNLTHEYLKSRSTTPEQEPEEYFIECFRLKNLLDTHKNFSKTIFTSGLSSIVYKFVKSSGWIPLNKMSKLCLQDSAITF